MERIGKASMRNDCIHVFVDGETCSICGKNKFDKSLPRRGGAEDVVDSMDSLDEADEGLEIDPETGEAVE
jgi:hypothetical protein